MASHSSSLISRFEKSLHKLCPNLGKPKGERRIGLAISGGVDSMALAYMCSQFQKQEKTGKLQFRAFIVDHVAREGSGAEAEAVAERVNRMGISSRILKLNWKQSLDDITNFETQARRMRFQALGKACRDSRISSLLLAHHEDDQAETILVRIAGGYTGAGLQGIRDQGDIPECFGIYGVHASGTLQEQPSWASAAKLSTTMPLADGGVIVKRPLLEMSKSSLIEVCRESDVEWFEDPTNKVATLTPRNTVRSLWESDRLPKALRKYSMLSLATLEQGRWLAQDQAGLGVFKKLAKSVDLAAGTMEFTITPTNYASISQSTALNVLDRMAQWISPRESFQRKQLAGISQLVFSSMSLSTPAEREDDEIHSFTAAGVQWHGEKVSTVPEIWQWQLSRQRPSMPVPTCTWSRDIGRTDRAALFGAWRLFDGRYWLRVFHEKRDSIIARTLTARELADLRGQLKRDDRREWDRFNAMLGDHAPGDVRYSLPVLFDGKGDVLALPSLGWTRKEEAAVLRYDIQYKRPS